VVDENRIEYAAGVLGVKPSTIHSYIERGWLGSCCEEDVQRLARLLSKRGRYSKPRRLQLENTKALIEHLKEIRGGKCEMCGTSERLQVHHILARRFGGTDDDPNLALLCYDCHFKTVHKYGKYGIHTWAVKHRQIRPEQLCVTKDALKKGFDDSADGTECKSAAWG